MLNKQSIIFSLCAVAAIILTIIWLGENVLFEDQQNEGIEISDTSFSTPNSEAISESPDRNSKPAPIAAKPISEMENLADWLPQWREQPSDQLLEKGLELARHRQAEMGALIVSKPGVAIDKMLSFPDYQALPPEIADIIEKPFAATGEILAMPFCSDAETHDHEDHHDDIEYFAKWNGDYHRIYLPEEREGLSSKKYMPLIGIELGGVSVLHRKAALELDADEQVAVSELFSLNRSSASYANALLVGDNLLTDNEVFENSEINEHLLNAEKQIGPTSVEAVLEVIVYANESTSTNAISQALEEAANVWTETPKKVLMLRAEFPDLESDYLTKEKVEEILAITSTRIQEMSYGKTWFSQIEVNETPYILPLETSYYSIGANYVDLLNDSLEQAQEAGVDSTQFDIIGVVFPRIDFSWAGRANVGGPYNWINGANSSSVWIHEFGHNYGLNHASSWDVSDGKSMPDVGEDTSSNSPLHQEYGDRFDVMGSGYHSDFGAAGKVRLNWIKEDQYHYIQSPITQTYRLYRFDERNADLSDSLALKLQVEDSETFWVSYRYYESDNIWLQQGAYITWEFQEYGNRNRLLDMTPTSQNGFSDSALPKGATFVDPTGRIKITTIDYGGDTGEEWIDVRVAISDELNHDPVVSLTAASHVIARTNIDFLANATDPDNDVLTYYWDFGDGNTTTSNSRTVSHSYHIQGNYNATVTVIDPNGGFSTDTVSVEVDDPYFPWQLISLENEGYISNLKYEDGRFLAISTTNILSSFDGITWQTTPSPIETYGYATMESGGFTVWGLDRETYQNALGYTFNGIDWIVDIIPTSNAQLAYGNNTWIAIGTDYYRKEVDGQWELIEGLHDHNLINIAYGDGVFVAITRPDREADGSDFVTRSYDKGKTWTAPQILHGRFSRLSFENGKFISYTMVGDSESEYKAEYRTSTDFGETWVTEFETTDNAYSTNFTANGDLIHFYDTQGIREHHFSSDGGKTWGKAAATPTLLSPSYESNRFGAGRFVIAGDSNKLLISQALEISENPSSEITLDGDVIPGQLTRVYANATDNDSNQLYYYWDKGDGIFRHGASYYDIEFTGATQTIRLVVTDGEGGISEESLEISAFNPFKSWQRVPTEFDDSLKDIIYHNARFITTGGENTLSSLDGISWRQSKNPFWAENIAGNEEGYMIVGYQTYPNSQATYGSIAYSTNGHYWTAENVINPPTKLSAILYGQGTWVAIGSEGAILYKDINESDDWKRAQTPVSVFLSIGAYGDGTFIAGGTGNTLLRSTDQGRTWINISSNSPFPPDETIREIIYHDGTFTIAGSSIIVSTDHGETWQSSLPNSNGGITTAIAQNDDFIFGAGWVQDQGTLEYSYYNNLSEDGTYWSRVDSDGEGFRHAATFGSSRIVIVGNNGYISASNTYNPSQSPRLELNGPEIAERGQTVTFSTSLTDPDSTKHYYYWALDGEIPVLGESSLSTTFNVSGNHTVKVLVSDGEGGIGVLSQAITVESSNAPPTVTLEGQSELTQGETVFFTAVAQDPDGDPLMYSWDLDENTYLSGGTTQSKTFNNIGSFNIKVTVTDSRGGSADATVSVTVNKPNTAPTLNLTGPFSAILGQEVTFNAEAIDIDGDSLTYTWDLSEGDTGSDESTQSKTFEQVGSYRITVTVSDGKGGVATSEHTIVVSKPNSQPTVIISGPSEVFATQTTVYTAVANDPDGDELTYNWNIGDAGEHSSEVTQTATFYQTGLITISVSVSDGKGGTVEAEFVVSVTNPNAPPSVDLEGDLLIEQNKLATFAANASDPEGDELSYQWDMGDGKFALGNSIQTKSFSEPGDYVIRVRVSDTQGGTAEDQLTVVVIKENANPTLQISGPTEVFTNTTTTYTAEAFDPDGDELTYQWDKGDGIFTAGSANQEISFIQERLYTIRAIVEDSNGGRSTATLDISATHKSNRPELFDQWIVSALDDDAADVTAPLADPDSDGLSNSIEYALGLNPKIHDADKSFHLDYDPSTQVESLKFMCRIDDPDLTTTCYLSEDLKTWVPIDLTYDSIQKSWLSSSLDIEITESVNLGSSLWHLSLSIRNRPVPLFVKFGVELE